MSQRVAANGTDRTGWNTCPALPFPSVRFGRYVMATAIGFALLGALGAIHYFGIQATRKLLRAVTPSGFRAPLITFMMLVLLHTAEIVFFALGFRATEAWVLPGALHALTRWEDYLYLSFVSFTTLGMTDLQIAGPIRILVGMQALGGFMVLTWSATFLYETAQKEEQGHT